MHSTLKWLNTIKIAILYFNIQHFHLFWVCVVSSKIVPGSDWNVELFNAEVTCQPFDKSYEAFQMKLTYNVIILW
jgi:hypothetical protein